MIMVNVVDVDIRFATHVEPNGTKKVAFIKKARSGFMSFCIKFLSILALLGVIIFLILHYAIK